MLDILEVFLNLYGYTYVRLDGSTSVDMRQKLMDRFNSDPKLFIFILSTRSGGLGINLTGADTVIFYDSDWNPAMDAQAQDRCVQSLNIYFPSNILPNWWLSSVLRAHRIGQTKDVHIYRLVCGSTVEENILVKAQQKKHLDFLVMTEGGFSEENLGAGSLFSSRGELKSLRLLSIICSIAVYIFCKGLKDVLGISDTDGEDKAEVPQSIEAAMAAAEDEEDLSAMRGARKEAALENGFDSLI